MNSRTKHRVVGSGLATCLAIGFGLHQGEKLSRLQTQIAAQERQLKELKNGPSARETLKAKKDLANSPTTKTQLAEIASALIELNRKNVSYLIASQSIEQELDQITARIEQFCGEDIETLLNFIGDERIDSSFSESPLQHLVLNKIAQINPRAFFDYYENSGNKANIAPDNLSHMATSAFGPLSSQDLSAAKQLCEELLDAGKIHRSDYLALQFARHDMNFALSLLRHDRESGEADRHSLQHFFRLLGHSVRSDEERDQFWKTLRAQDRHTELLRGAINGFTYSDDGDALDWVQQQEFTADELAEIALDLKVFRLDKTLAPGDWIRWAYEGMGSDHSYSKSRLIETVGDWAEMDHAATAQWINSLAKGSDLHQQSIAEFAKHVAPYDLEAARQWAGRISDVQQRAKLLDSLAK